MNLHPFIFIPLAMLAGIGALHVLTISGLVGAIVL